MSLNEAQSLLFRHFEKLTVAGVLTVIIAYLLCLAVGSSEAAQLKARTQAAVEKIELAKENPELPEALSVDFYTQAKKAFAQVPQVGAEPSWFAFKRPYVVRRVIFRTRPRPKHLPVLLAAKADVGQVQLTWQDSAENANVEIVGYELWRRKGKNPWQLVKRLPEGNESYLDKGLEHEQEYSYKLLSFVQPLPGTTPFADPADATRESEVMKVRTPFNFGFDINSWGQGRIGGKIKIPLPGGKKEYEDFSFRKGDKVIINGRDTGWIVDKVEGNSLTIKKGNRIKTFSE